MEQDGPELCAVPGAAGQQAVQTAPHHPQKVNPGSGVLAASRLYQFVLDPTERVLHNWCPGMKCFTSVAFNHLAKGDGKTTSTLGLASS